MVKNIKKKSAHNIYFGVDKKTGVIRPISAVPSGARCGCVCAACNKPLEARKGDVRRHHFAHESNYECVYANEVAIYREVARIMDAERVLVLPQISLRFPSWNDEEVLRPAQTLSLQMVTYSCGPLQYPPELVVTAAGQKLRILIEFGNYYTKDDLKSIVSEARKEGHSALLFQFPNILDTDFFTSARLTDYIIHGKSRPVWLRSTLEDQWRNHFLSHAHTPTKNSVGYECPIHVAKYGEMFAAQKEDCIHCRFNLGEWPRCLCIGSTGIQSPRDFDLAPEDLQVRISELRAANERKIEELEQRSVDKPQFSWSQAKYTGPSEADLNAEYEQVVASFDPESKEQTIDRYGRRWILCEECGEIKLDRDMTEYGGRQRGPNRGTCRECSRKW